MPYSENPNSSGKFVTTRSRDGFTSASAPILKNTCAAAPMSVQQKTSRTERSLRFLAVLVITMNYHLTVSAGMNQCDQFFRRLGGFRGSAAGTEGMPGGPTFGSGEGGRSASVTSGGLHSPAETRKDATGVHVSPALAGSCGLAGTIVINAHRGFTVRARERTGLNPPGERSNCRRLSWIPTTRSESRSLPAGPGQW